MFEYLSRLSSRAAMALCVVMVGTVGLAQADQFKRVRDVNVSCTDRLRCDLFVTNPRVPLNSFALRRSAEPDAPVSIVLSIREPLTARSELAFRVDGEEIARVTAEDFSYRAALYEYSLRDDAIADRMIEAGKAGRTLQIEYRTRSGQSTAPFSLSGFIAGLIFMDEVQGRIGRSDALQNVSRSTDSAAAGGTMRDLNRWSDVPFEIRSRYFRGESSLCGDADVERFSVTGGIEVENDAGGSLFALPCGPGGAYNFPFAFWYQNGTQIRHVALPVMTEAGPSTTDFAWNAAWNEETDELTAFFKGRGLGDCGMFDRWQWTDRGDGYAFVLVESRNKDACDGEYGDGPESWPLIWPEQ